MGQTGPSSATHVEFTLQGLFVRTRLELERLFCRGQKCGDPRRIRTHLLQVKQVKVQGRVSNSSNSGFVEVDSSVAISEVTQYYLRDSESDVSAKVAFQRQKWPSTLIGGLQLDWGEPSRLKKGAFKLRGGLQH